MMKLSPKVRLRELRERRKLTQGQLAMRIGVHRSYITKIEQGHRMPGRDLLFRLVRDFGCRVEDLIEFESDHMNRA